MSLSGMTVDEMNSKLDDSTLSLIRVTHSSWLVCAPPCGTPMYIENQDGSHEEQLLSVQKMHLRLKDAESVFALDISETAMLSLSSGLAVVRDPHNIAGMHFRGVQDAFRALRLTFTVISDTRALEALLMLASEFWPMHRIQTLSILTTPLTAFRDDDRMSITTTYEHRNDPSLIWSHPSELPATVLRHLYTPFATVSGWNVHANHINVQLREYNAPYVTRCLPLQRVFPSPLIAHIREMAKSARHGANALYSITKICVQRGCPMTLKTFQNILSYYSGRSPIKGLQERMDAGVLEIVKEHMLSWTNAETIAKKVLPRVCTKQIAENYEVALTKCIADNGAAIVRKFSKILSGDNTHRLSVVFQEYVDSLSESEQQAAAKVILAGGNGDLKQKDALFKHGLPLIMMSMIRTLPGDQVIVERVRSALLAVAVDRSVSTVVEYGFAFACKCINTDTPSRLRSLSRCYRITTDDNATTDCLRRLLIQHFMPQCEWSIIDSMLSTQKATRAVKVLVRGAWEGLRHSVGGASLREDDQISTFIRWMKQAGASEVHLDVLRMRLMNGYGVLCGNDAPAVCSRDPAYFTTKLPHLARMTSFLNFNGYSAPRIMPVCTKTSPYYLRLDTSTLINVLGWRQCRDLLKIQPGVKISAGIHGNALWSAVLGERGSLIVRKLETAEAMFFSKSIVTNGYCANLLMLKQTLPTPTLSTKHTREGRIRSANRAPAVQKDMKYICQHSPGSLRQLKKTQPKQARRNTQFKDPLIPPSYMSFGRSFVDASGVGCWTAPVSASSHLGGDPSPTGVVLAAEFADANDENRVMTLPVVDVRLDEETTARLQGMSLDALAEIRNTCLLNCDTVEQALSFARGKKRKDEALRLVRAWDTDAHTFRANNCITAFRVLLRTCSRLSLTKGLPVIPSGYYFQPCKAYSMSNKKQRRRERRRKSGLATQQRIREVPLHQELLSMMFYLEMVMQRIFFTQIGWKILGRRVDLSKLFNGVLSQTIKSDSIVKSTNFTANLLSVEPTIQQAQQRLSNTVAASLSNDEPEHHNSTAAALSASAVPFASTDRVMRAAALSKVGSVSVCVCAVLGVCVSCVCVSCALCVCVSCALCVLCCVCV